MVTFSDLPASTGNTNGGAIKRQATPHHKKVQSSGVKKQRTSLSDAKAPFTGTPVAPATAPKPFTAKATTPLLSTTTKSASATSNTRSDNRTTQYAIDLDRKKAELNEKFQMQAVNAEAAFKQELTRIISDGSTGSTQALLGQYLSYTAAMEDQYWVERSLLETAASGGQDSGKVSNTTAKNPMSVDTPVTGASLNSSSAVLNDAAAEKIGKTPVSAMTSEMGGEFLDMQVLRNVSVYHHRDGVATKFCSGALRIQKHGQNASQRRILMRNNVGKVLLNMQLHPDMTFSGQIQVCNKNPEAGKECAAFVGIIDKKPERFTIARHLPFGVVQGGNRNSLQSILARAATGA